MQSKMVFKIWKEISCSSFHVKEFDVIVHKKVFSLYSPIKFLAILYLKSRVNLVVEEGTRLSLQILTIVYNSIQNTDDKVRIRQHIPKYHYEYVKEW